MKGELELFIYKDYCNIMIKFMDHLFQNKTSVLTSFMRFKKTNLKQAKYLIQNKLRHFVGLYWKALFRTIRHANKTFITKTTMTKPWECVQVPSCSKTQWGWCKINQGILSKYISISKEIWKCYRSSSDCPSLPWK